MAKVEYHLDRVIEGALARERIVGVVALVGLNGDVIYRRAAGMADREIGRHMHENTVFLLASVTKLIVSAAAMALVDRGTLSLEDPVTRWIPDFRPKLGHWTPIIRVRHLLNHTAGLSYGFMLADKSYRDAGVSSGLDQPGLSIEEELRRLESVPLLFEPGTNWRYSISTDVLGEVLARAANRSLPELVRETVTRPLGVDSTDFIVHDPDRLAVPYADGMPHPVRMRDPHDVPSATGIVRFAPSRIRNPMSYPSGGAGMAGTAPDLFALLEAIRSGGSPILSPESVRCLTTNAVPEGVSYEEQGWSFSLGAAVLEEPGIARTPHGRGTYRWGGAYGHTWFVDPSWGLTVVCFTNTAFEGVDGAFPMDLRDAIYYGLCSS